MKLNLFHQLVIMTKQELPIFYLFSLSGTGS